MIDFVKDVRLWFAPSKLRDEGETPDYRFSLANERTFLAWIRTALALVGGGFAVDQFLPDLRWGVRVGMALALLAVGAACALRAVNHWVRCERAMRRGDDLPLSRFPVVLSVGVGLVALAMVVVVLLGWTKR
ncbi:MULTISPECIES: YidH family protein [unclassified Streptomyces]|uniref:YidH family protein n=1 Tax=unclassified Streptomyces TaxID=2593676 RepID=UPI0036C9C52A